MLRRFNLPPATELSLVDRDLGTPARHGELRAHLVKSTKRIDFLMINTAIKCSL